MSSGIALQSGWQYWQGVECPLEVLAWAWSICHQVIIVSRKLPRNFILIYVVTLKGNQDLETSISAVCNLVGLIRHVVVLRSTRELHRSPRYVDGGSRSMAESQTTQSSEVNMLKQHLKVFLRKQDTVPTRVKKNFFASKFHFIITTTFLSLKATLDAVLELFPSEVLYHATCLPLQLLYRRSAMCSCIPEHLFIVVVG